MVLVKVKVSPLKSTAHLSSLSQQNATLVNTVPYIFLTRIASGSQKISKSGGSTEVKLQSNSSPK